MVEITNGQMTLVVSKGAFKSIYAPDGWSPVPGTQPCQAQVSHMDVSTSGEPNSSTKGEKSSEGQNKASQEPDISQDKISDDKILEGMSLDELKQYASLIGLDTKKLKSRESLRKAINLISKEG